MSGAGLKAPLPAAPQRHHAWVLLATVAAVLLTARLGWWQLDRAEQKNTLQTAMATQRARPPVPLAELPLAAGPTVAAANPPAWLHRAVVLQGQWLTQHTVYLDNRQMNQRVGFYAVTPLLLPDGSAALVQRGWLPRDLMDRTRLLPVPTPDGVVQVQGRLAPEVSRLYEFSGAASGPIRQNLDIAAFAADIKQPLRPWVVVQEDMASSPASTQPTKHHTEGLLRQWPAPASGVHKHYGYAFQWFALSALCAGLYVWFAQLRPRLKQRRAG